MPYERDRDQSIRANIAAHFTGRIEGMRAGVDRCTTEFDRVYREPMPAADKRDKLCCSVLDERERSTEELGATRCTLSITTEFSYRLGVGEVASVELNRILLDVQRAILSDPQCSCWDVNTSRQLAIDTVKRGVELDIEGPGDRMVGGVVFWEIQFRHKPDDPSKFRGE